ncbi:MAG: hypothetical protein ACMXYD_00095 [Candidatus Woesearchaeota archaeon]
MRSSAQQQQFHEIAVYLAKHHKIEYALLMKLINEVETDEELGPEYLENHLKSFNQKREYLEKLHKHPIKRLDEWPALHKLERLADTLEKNSLDLLAKIVSDVQKHDSAQIATDLYAVHQELEKLKKVLEEEISELEKKLLEEKQAA